MLTDKPLLNRNTHTRITERYTVGTRFALLVPNVSPAHWKDSLANVWVGWLFFAFLLKSTTHKLTHARAAEWWSLRLPDGKMWCSIMEVGWWWLVSNSKRLDEHAHLFVVQICFSHYHRACKRTDKRKNNNCVVNRSIALHESSTICFCLHGCIVLDECVCVCESIVCFHICCSIFCWIYTYTYIIRIRGAKLGST